MKILVAIASYGTANDRFLHQLLANYRALPHDVRLVVLSNVPRPDLGHDVEVDPSPAAGFSQVWDGAPVDMLFAQGNRAGGALRQARSQRKAAEVQERGKNRHLILDHPDLARHPLLGGEVDRRVPADRGQDRRALGGRERAVAERNDGDSREAKRDH